ncbi:NADH-quinone oxidoreductase subunit C [Streptomyces sp. NBC_00158]|uniref:NADH-quinone oxidoreductase subunit C n=1 Tax=Streptomyces sp. NBC_00158 TaxID=2903627 RepID=UPI00324846E6
MNLYDSLPEAAGTVFGAEAVASSAYELLTVDVPVGSWISALEIARDKLGCTYFDWLSAVDEPGTGFRVCAHVVSLENHRVRRLLLRTTVPHSAPSLPSAVAVYAGAEWHERETFEMFGVTFTDHPNLVHLLLPENFEGHPLRKDFVLAARVAKAWPGAKEPGEAHDPDAPKRRQMLPPGVPDPNDWGPLKGQLPPAPSRPARAPRAAGAGPARAPREGAPVRRTRSVAEGSATQTTPDDTPDAPRPPRRTRSVTDGSASQTTPADAPETPRPPRRTRSVTDGSASQATPAADAPETADEPGTPETGAPVPPAAAPGPARPPRRTRSASDGSASQAAPPEPGTPDSPAEAPETPRPARRTRSASDGSASQTPPAPDTPPEATATATATATAPEPEAPRRPAPRSADAPWHNPKPAFEEPPAPEAEPKPRPRPEAEPETDTTGGDA